MRRERDNKEPMGHVRTVLYLVFKIEIVVVENVGCQTRARLAFVYSCEIWSETRSSDERCFLKSSPRRCKNQICHDILSHPPELDRSPRPCTKSFPPLSVCDPSYQKRPPQTPRFE